MSLLVSIGSLKPSQTCSKKNPKTDSSTWNETVRRFVQSLSNFCLDSKFHMESSCNVLPAHLRPVCVVLRLHLMVQKETCREINDGDNSMPHLLYVFFLPFTDRGYSDQSDADHHQPIFSDRVVVSKKKKKKGRWEALIRRLNATQLDHLLLGSHPLCLSPCSRFKASGFAMWFRLWYFWTPLFENL